MFKMMATLIRGQAEDAAQEFADANALPLLRQQIREATVALKRTTQTVGIAVASHKQELARYEKIKSQIADLETRALAALEAKQSGLAQEAAESIAALENEKTFSEQAQKRYESEISRLKHDIRAAQLKLRDLQRSERLATATGHAQSLARITPTVKTSPLRDAEDTLSRLQNRQETIDLSRNAEIELEQQTAPRDIVHRMAEAGLGKPIQSNADIVLERLKAKKSSPSPSKSKD